MAASGWGQAIGEAQAAVVEAQQELLSPTAEALERTWGPLERAQDALARLLECLKALDLPSRAAARPELERQMKEFSREVTRLRALLEGAAALRLGWARKLYAAACGYTGQGEPALPTVARRLSLEA